MTTDNKHPINSHYLFLFFIMTGYMTGYPHPLRRVIAGKVVGGLFKQEEQMCKDPEAQVSRPQLRNAKWFNKLKPTVEAEL